MEYFVTADHHFGHGNIIRYCSRPFKNLEQMNDEMIVRWNERVAPEDVVYYVGDFCFKNTPGGKPGEGLPIVAKDWEKELNGKIVHIIGNHDRNNSVKSRIISLQINYGGDIINMEHRPEEVSGEYQINFCGHVHNNWRYRKMKGRNGKMAYIVNVGVDVWDFRPKKIDELLVFLQRIKRGVIIDEGAEDLYMPVS